jgi:diguanylate cyclase (GGDEF)-like protein
LYASSVIEPWDRSDTLTVLTRALNVPGVPVLTVIVDIDELAGINDRHGEAAGDALLREVGARLRRALPANAAVGRWVADEFFVVIPDADVEGARPFVERLRDAVTAQPLIHDGDAIPIGVTCGWSLRSGPASPTAALAEAVTSLRRAKRGSRGAQL